MLSYKNRHKSIGNLSSMSPNKILNTNELVVNNDPDLPLFVPLNYSSLELSERVELMKKKNLDRFETAAKNLEVQAEREKHELMEKLKKKKKYMKSVEKNYELERHYTKSLIDKRKSKAEGALKFMKDKEKKLENQGMRAYRK